MSQWTFSFINFFDKDFECCFLMVRQNAVYNSYIINKDSNNVVVFIQKEICN